MPKKKSELWNLKFLTKETETRKKFHRVSNNRSLKAHCKPWCIARREHKSQFSCYRKLLIVVKGSLSSYFKAIYHLFVFFVYVCKYAPDYLYSIYTCDLSPLRFAVVGRIALRFPFISRSNRLGIRSNSPGYPSKKTAIRSNGSGYPFEPFERLVSCTTAPKQFHRSSSRRICQKMFITLPSVVYHHLMYCQGTFSTLSIFSFYNGRLSLQVLFKTEFLEQVMFWPFCMQMSNDFGSLVSPVGIHSHWQW